MTGVCRGVCVCVCGVWVVGVCEFDFVPIVTDRCIHDHCFIPEASYAFALQSKKEKKKPKMIPLRLEANYEPDGWLGLVQATTLYFKLHPGLPDDLFDENFARLLQAIDTHCGVSTGKDTSKKKKIMLKVLTMTPLF